MVRIELSWRDGVAQLRIADDGRGIRPGEIEEQLAHGHIGLTSRRVRLEAVGRLADAAGRRAVGHGRRGRGAGRAARAGRVTA